MGVAPLGIPAPLVPVTPKAKVPIADGAWMVMVVDPLPVTEVGLKLAVAPEGRVGAAKVTVSANPFWPLTVSFACTVPPAPAVMVLG